MKAHQCICGYDAHHMHILCTATLNNHNTCTTVHTPSDAQHNICTPMHMWLWCTNTCTTRAQGMMIHNICTLCMHNVCTTTHNTCTTMHTPSDAQRMHNNAYVLTMHKHMHNTCTMYDAQDMHDVSTTATTHAQQCILLLMHNTCTTYAQPPHFWGTCVLWDTTLHTVCTTS